MVEKKRKHLTKGETLAAEMIIFINNSILKEELEKIFAWEKTVERANHKYDNLNGKEKDRYIQYLMKNLNKEMLNLIFGNLPIDVEIFY